MKRHLLSVLLSGLVCSSSVYADDRNSNNIYSFDTAYASDEYRNFPFVDEKDIEPRRSDFAIVNQRFLSSPNGGRLAVVTLENLTNGARGFSEKYIVAVFANGDKRFARDVSFQVSGGESVNYTFNFGTYSLPILYVYTTN